MQLFELGNSRAQVYFIRTVPIGPIYKSESRDSLFCDAQVNHRQMFKVTWSIYVYYISLYLCEPDTVENVSVWEDSDVQIGSQDTVERSDLLIPNQH